MNITKIIPAEVSGYCDVTTGECITADLPPDAGPDADGRRGTSVRPEEPDKRLAPSARD